MYTVFKIDVSLIYQTQKTGTATGPIADKWRNVMTQIINNFNFTFSPSAQDAIRNAAANCGVDEVITCKNSTDGGKETLFDFCDAEENYLFSIDLEGDVIWNKR